MLTWIEEVFDQGVRRPGYPADRWTEQFVHDRFMEWGLEEVRTEPVQAPYWKDHEVELTVGAGLSGFDVPCFAVPFSQPTSARGNLVRWDPADREAVKGNIAVCELVFPRLPALFPVLSRSGEGWYHDPSGEIAEATHIPPFTTALMNTMEPAITAGAVGFVGVLQGYPGGGCHYYVPYDGGFRSIPGVYVGATDGASILGLLEDGPVPASLRVEAERASTTCHNVVGELAGVDEEWVVIGTHHDGPWASAVEDGSGISLVLAQARYWSQLPPEQRPHRLVFTVNAAHMAGGCGTQAFIDTHAAALDGIVLEIHLEHAARECVEVDGKLKPTDVPVPRWWFTSENPELEEAVRDTLVTEQLDRSLIVAPAALGERPTTDGGFFHDRGVPLVNYLTAPWYLFDAADTMDKIHVPSLEPVTRAAIRLVEWTAGRSARSVREGVRR